MRPTKYDSSFCEVMISLMKEGASIEEVAAEIGISKQTLYNWSDVHDEFLDAKKRGEELSCAWWLRQGRVNLENSKFSPTLFYMNMKNRFGWRDKQETDVTSKGEKIQVITNIPYADNRDTVQSEATPVSDS